MGEKRPVAAAAAVTTATGNKGNAEFRLAIYNNPEEVQRRKRVELQLSAWLLHTLYIQGSWL